MIRLELLDKLMKLVTPTDFEVLEALSDEKRNNAVNLAVMLNRNRSYINTRLPMLAAFGLVERVGPASNSGLYAITSKGHAVVHHRESYGRDDIDFEALIARELAADE